MRGQLIIEISSIRTPLYRISLVQQVQILSAQQSIMSRPGFENIQSVSGISGIGDINSSFFNDQSKATIPPITITINAPSGLTPPPAKPKEDPNEAKLVTMKNPYTTATTGYDINRQLFSEEEIRQAFSLIDINKDNALTFDDLSFFLDCMGQQHTREEVEEMVKMVSTNGSEVFLQDFKKIGKGKIIPLAGIKLPDQNTKTKQTILNNIKSHQISSQDPQVIQKLHQELSFAKFQEQKAKKNEVVELEVSDAGSQEETDMLPRTTLEIKLKKGEYGRVRMINVEELIRVLESSQTEYLDSKDISQLLTIGELQAQGLFLAQNRRARTRQIILDSILFSPKLPLKKLELILQHSSRSQTLSFEEWLQVLVFMLGTDQRETIRKRLTAILKHRKLDIFNQYDKKFIVEVMTQEVALFNW